MTRYEQGFLTKCAEHGVDGRALLKSAFKISKINNIGELINRLIRAPYDKLDAFANSKVDEAYLRRLVSNAKTRIARMHLPENHPARAGLARSESQLQPWPKGQIYEILDNMQDKRLAATLARSHKNMGTFFIG